jgi:hypothetical protein
MSEPSNVAKVWLFLLEEGGCWETHVIRERTGLTSGAMRTALHSMVDKGNVIRQRDEMPFLYSVDGSCFVPHGVSVEDLQKAGMRMAG